LGEIREGDDEGKERGRWKVKRESKESETEKGHRVASAVWRRPVMERWRWRESV